MVFLNLLSSEVLDEEVLVEGLFALRASYIGSSDPPIFYQKLDALLEALLAEPVPTRKFDTIFKLIGFVADSTIKLSWDWGLLYSL